MKKTLIIAGLGFLVAAVPAAAESDSAASAFMKCARIASDGQRLLCYDRLATELIELGLSARGGLPESPAPEAAPPASGAAEAPAAGAQDAPAATSEAADASSGSSSDYFGSERIEDGPGNDVDRIQSRYVGEFTGWDGKTIFELENGQVWQQIGSGRMTYRATNPMITIKRAFMGSYLLKVEGRNKSVRVKRIK